MSLTLSNIRVSVAKKEILHGISFCVKRGEVHALMGPNGSGKSTLAYVMMGHPDYTITGNYGTYTIDGKNIVNKPAHERAKAGLFLSFQSPVAVPGVSVMNVLRMAYEELYGAKKEQTQNPLLAKRTVGSLPIGEFFNVVKKYAHSLSIDESLLSRGIHDGFSGGERKKIEMLTALVLSPKYAIFDEIDTGLDVDALKKVARGIAALVKNGTGVLIITHYRRILKHIKPDVVHVMVHGKIVKTGSASIAKTIEEKGYAGF